MSTMEVDHLDQGLGLPIPPGLQLHRLDFAVEILQNRVDTPAFKKATVYVSWAPALSR